MSTPVLLYDGRCGFCAASVQFVLARDRTRTLAFASLDSAFAARVRHEWPGLSAVDSIVWYEPATPGRAAVALTHSTAALRVARYLGRGWRIFSVLAVIPRPIRDAVYRAAAAHRHRLLRNNKACLVPSAEDARRFLA